MTHTPTLTADLRTLLAQHGIQQKDLARALGITEQAVSRTLSRGTMTQATHQKYRTALLQLIIQSQQREIDRLRSERTTLTCPHCGREISIKVE